VRSSTAVAVAATLGGAEDDLHKRQRRCRGEGIGQERR
jgi:hypothetical protein